MRSKKLSGGLIAILCGFALTMLMTATTTAAQTEKVLYGFTDNSSGSSPVSVTFDAAGNMYGTLSQGGNGVCPNRTEGCGEVFELSPNGNGGWTRKTLHEFPTNGSDGFYPQAKLIFDAAGNLYGTTLYGGSRHEGTVFELSPQANGNWTEKILHDFSNDGTDGKFPWAGVVFDAAGNLYGTTFGGGTYTICEGGCGVVFELSPAGNGTWTEKILLNFGSDYTDAYAPDFGPLIFDAAGNLYGTSGGGGTYGSGTAFEISPAASGSWTETILHSFGSGSGDGSLPQGGLTFDAAGNLYGTTYYGGAYNFGMAFELTPAGGRTWSETIMHSFDGETGDGTLPRANLILDSSGNVYGTTTGGGANIVGTVFELSPGSGGSWTETILHSFQDNVKDGEHPGASLIFGSSGNIYGTTAGGGEKSGGTVFEITP
jgi:uncharacterized repeat protein (TIGR03803 family)